MVDIKSEPRGDYTLISFELNDDVSSAELLKIKPPEIGQEVSGTKGVVISGRGPIWLYAYLVHCYHPVKWIATYDPRLGGAVVVESHGGPLVGTLVPVELSL